MTRPMTGKAEIVLEYPDKFHIGTFGRTDRFDARFEANEVLLTVQCEDATGACRSMRLQLQPQVFVDLVSALAQSVCATAPSEVHREALCAAAETLHHALAARSVEPAVGAEKERPARIDLDDVTDLTPEEEVLLLHVME